MVFKKLLRTLQNLNHTPALALAEWPCLHDANRIAYVALFLFVVRHELARLIYELPVFTVHLLPLDGNRDGLGHGIRGDDANSFLTQIALGTCNVLCAHDLV